MPAAPPVLHNRPMHLHVLGICGTFMGGLAALAREAGHRVTGCDANVYPPMSDQLARPRHRADRRLRRRRSSKLAPDLFVVGNAITRGNPLLEADPRRRRRLHQRPAVAGRPRARRPPRARRRRHPRQDRHDVDARLDPRVGRASARASWSAACRSTSASRRASATAAAPFVIEADEYDTAFFDKRSKFVHYRPRTAILNNLEFDHADIFDDLAAIERQFHHLVRTVPAQRPAGRQRPRRGAAARARDGLLERACSASAAGRKSPGMLRARGEPHAFDVLRGGLKIARVEWPLLGEHNQLNALAAIAAAEHVGVAPEVAARALGELSQRAAPARAARRRSAASPSTTTSRTTRPRCARPSTACAARSARRASSPSSSRARTR